jgi:hypothetical protein
MRSWAATAAQEARLEAWQRGLLATLGLDEQSHPSALLAALGLDLESDSNHWLRAQAIHLAAGLNEVTLVPLRGEAALTAEECETLTPVLNEHLAASGVRIHRTSSNDWLIESSQGWDATTVTAQFALDHEWSEVLPQGRDAGQLRRLMTELQMLLHEHPVNQRRSAQGMPTANAVWFWGNGRAQKSASAQNAACMGANVYLQGLCRLHAWTCPTEVSAELLITKCAQIRQVIGIADVSSLDELESKWLAPLVAALKQGSFDRLRLILDTWEIDIDRWQLRAFWRRDLPFAAWAHS